MAATKPVSNSDLLGAAAYNQSVRLKRPKLLIFNKIAAMKREKALKTINELPSEFNLDELIDRLIFIEKVEKGNQQRSASEMAEAVKTLSQAKTIAKELKDPTLLRRIDIYLSAAKFLS